jgi:leucyl aminopeptidase
MQKILLVLGFASFTLSAAPILTEASLLEEAGLQAIVSDPETGLAFADLDEAELRLLSERGHEHGRCGGFKALPQGTKARSQKLRSLFEGVRSHAERQATYVQSAALSRRAPRLERKPEIEAAVSEVSERNLKTWVEWFSAFPTRYNRASTANDHVTALETKMRELIAGVAYPVSVDLIAHSSTPQKSMRVRIEGRTRPQETVVLGGHFDSISGFFGTGRAPGSDDNASGSSNLIEALRIVLTQPQPERSIEFFWYAGEESGLLGSGEIAESYKRQRRDVVAVMQLDMTLHPGNGEFVIGLIQDHTSAWLNDYFAALNEAYIGATVLADECGYACSDHASWTDEGYSAFFPFEATSEHMNHEIHTPRDVINAQSNFRHMATFSKIAVAFALDFANSSLRQP